MVSDSKSDVRKYRGFKSLLLRNFNDPTISQRCFLYRDAGPEPFVSGRGSLSSGTRVPLIGTGSRTLSMEK